jgi:hypothetical protein
MQSFKGEIVPDQLNICGGASAILKTVRLQEQGQFLLTRPSLGNSHDTVKFL